MSYERDIILEHLNNNSPVYFKSFKLDMPDMNLEIINDKFDFSYVNDDELHIKTKLINKKNKIGDVISRIKNDKKVLIKFTIIEYSCLCLVKRKYNFIAEISLNSNSKEELSTLKMSVYSINKMSSYVSNYFLENTYYSMC
jgi:hypothetical protein